MSTNNDEEIQFSRKVGDRAKRRLRARLDGKRGIWYGLGMLGLVGWSVAIPSVAGVLLGSWLDRHHPHGHSWTLSLLVTGMIFGCWAAWHWVLSENSEMNKEENNNAGK